MKRIYLLIAACVILSPTLLKAQGVPKVDLDLGIKLGANFNKVNGEYWDNGYKANFLGGVYAAVNGGKIGVQAEAIFSQSTYNTGKGFYSVYKGLYTNVTDSAKQGSFRVNYLSIPVMLNLKLFPRVMIQLGPQYSGVVSIKDKDALVKDAEGLFKSGEISGVVGLWLNLPLHLNIGARYVFGLSNINNVDGKTAAKVDDAWKNRTLQVHLGYTIF